jgi:hypothetical protein
MKSIETKLYSTHKKTSKMAKKVKWIFFINNQGTEIGLKPFEYFKKDYANLMLFY